MKKLNMMLALTVVLAVSASGAVAGVVPWYDGNDGNPYTDGNGDQWSVHQIASSGTTYQDWSNYTAMTWNATYSRWDGNDLKYGHPTYVESHKVLDSTGYSGNRRSALIFDPSVVGPYSWTGDLYYNDHNGTRTSTIYFGKFSSSNVWTELHVESVTEGEIMDLGSISALQNISVAAGERLALALCPSSSAVAAVYFDRTGGTAAGINLVPEPATLCLLAIGGIGMLVRKKARS